MEDFRGYRKEFLNVGDRTEHKADFGDKPKLEPTKNSIYYVI